MSIENEQSHVPLHSGTIEVRENDESLHRSESDHIPQPQELKSLEPIGEPCPAPLIWQEVRESFLRESTPWEIVRGPHRLFGRTIGNGPPLYFLNNFAATAELFCLSIWLLRDRFRCVVFDATTDSRSIARHSKSTMGEFAADLFAVADNWSDRQFSIYGAGFGAAVALRAALDRPESISGMVLQHGFAKRRLSLSERFLASLCLYSGQTLDKLPQRRRFQAVNHKPWFPPVDPSRFDFLMESTGTLLLRDLARRAFAVDSFDVLAQLCTVSCPITLLRTEGEGRMAAESQIVLENGLNFPKTEWLHSAGQHPYLTHPHRVTNIIKSCFQSDENRE